MAVCGILLGTSAVGATDYMEYWASGQQFMHHGDPFDPVAMLRVERAAGLSNGVDAMIAGNLPTALPLFSILGLCVGAARRFVLDDAFVGSPGGVGADGPRDAREPEELPALAGIFICAGNLLPGSGPGVAAGPARAGVVSLAESDQPASGWGVSLAMCFKAAFVSALRRCDCCMGICNPKLQTPCRRRSCHRAERWVSRGSGSGGMDAMDTNDALRKARQAGHSMHEPPAAAEHQPGFAVAAIFAGCGRLHLGARVLSQAQG